MQKIIVDASVGAKWIFDEDLAEKARDLLIFFEQKRLEIVVPEFFYLELANVCFTKKKRKIVSSEEFIPALDSILKISFERYCDFDLADVALENALHYKISVYDALYVALAETYVSPLVTADEKLYQTLKGRFDFIESLKDFEIFSLS